MDGCSVCSQKLKSVGFPFTNGTCWCYSWNPSCEPSWFWSSITSRFPTTLHHYLLPSKSFPATHFTPCDVLIDNILLDQIHLNTVPMRRWLPVNLPPLIIRHHPLSAAGARSNLTIKKQEKKGKEKVIKKKRKSNPEQWFSGCLLWSTLFCDLTESQSNSPSCFLRSPKNACLSILWMIRMICTHLKEQSKML